MDVPKGIAKNGDTIVGCEIETSLRVGYYNPDVIVSAYNGLTHAKDKNPITGAILGGMPWQEMRGVLSDLELKVGSLALKVMGNIPKDIASGGGFSVGAKPAPAVIEQSAHQDMIFKEVNIVGHPLASVTGMLGSLACPSDATMLKPYYLSSLDAIAWRWSLPEIVYPQSWIPGLREIGSFPFYTWGAVYPRSGFGTQTDDAKLAAVTAQRAADVTTRSGQPHLYLSLGPGTPMPLYQHSGNQEVWVPGRLTENDPKMGRWQMLSPKLSKTCTVFGRNDLVSVTGAGGGRIAGNGAYSWILWRPYQCCETKGAFIGTFPPPATAYPPPHMKDSPNAPLL